MAETLELQNRLVDVVATILKVEPSRITLDSRFVDDLGADSLDMLTLLMQLEDEFGASIPDDEAKSLKTVGAVLELIRSKTSGQ